MHFRKGTALLCDTCDKDKCFMVSRSVRSERDFPRKKNMQEKGSEGKYKIKKEGKDRLGKEENNGKTYLSNFQKQNMWFYTTVLKISSEDISGNGEEHVADGIWSVASEHHLQHVFMQGQPPQPAHCALWKYAFWHHFGAIPLQNIYFFKRPVGFHSTLTY